MTDTADPLADRARAVLDATRRATEAFGREDLTARLDQAAERLGQAHLDALVVGEFKKGKSTLVNALLNVDVCPVSDEVATVVPTVVRHGEEPAAAVLADPTDPIAADRPDDDDRSDAAELRTAIAVAEVADWASEWGNLDNTRAIRAVEVRVPRRLLASGLALVDTPGVGGLHSMHGAATMAALAGAEVVLFVTDASQELSAVELDVLRTAIERCPTVICVMTKTDLYPSWRRIAELDRDHLDRVGLSSVPVIPVSSVVRQAALARSSKALNEESGYPALVQLLDRSVVARARQVSVQAAVASARFALDQLTSTFASERGVLEDPEGLAPLVAELERSKERAERLRTRSARWQQTLGDGSQDLATEVEHDLRARLRELTSTADDAMADHDPSDVWDEFSAWLRREVAVQVGHNTVVLRDAANALAARVSEHFAIDEAAIVHVVDVGGAPVIPGELEVELERAARGSGALAAMRGSYGGMLMFGMVGQVVGLAMLNPVTAVIGIGLGRRALRDERKRMRNMRTQQAKQAFRRYLDEVTFAVTKDTRDAIRLVQRELRDEFNRRAEELQRSTRESLAAAEAAARQTTEERQRRLAVLDQHAEKLLVVGRAADELEAACAAPVPEVAR